MLTSVLFPTRRAHLAAKALKSLYATAEGEIELIVGQNPDCVFETPGIKHISESGTSKRVWEMAQLCTGEIISVGCDDFIWSQGWDRKFHQYAQKHPIACFYFDSGPRDCIPVVTRKFYDIAGYYPPHFFHSYGDGWVVKIAEKAGCLVETNIALQHLRLKDKVDMRGRIETDIWINTQDERTQLINKLKPFITKRHPIPPSTQAYLDKREC